MIRPANFPPGHAGEGHAVIDAGKHGKVLLINLLGRVWSGTDALEIGLIDEYGGVVDAVYYAAELTGMDTDQEPEVRIYPTPSFPGSIALPGFGVSEYLLEFLGSDQVLYLMQPVYID